MLFLSTASTTISTSVGNRHVVIDAIRACVAALGFIVDAADVLKVFIGSRRTSELFVSLLVRHDSLSCREATMVNELAERYLRGH